MRHETLILSNSLWRRLAGVKETPTILIAHRAQGEPVSIEFVQHHHPDHAAALLARGVLPLLQPEGEDVPDYAQTLRELEPVEITFATSAHIYLPNGQQGPVDFMWAWSLADGDELLWDSIHGGPFPAGPEREVQGIEWVRRLFAA